MSAEALIGVHAMPHQAVPEFPAAGALPARDFPAAVRYPRIDELCDQMATVCASAVDPLEIAAALEFEGLGDEAVRKRYGLPDVFALAQEMFQRVPRAPAEPEQDRRVDRTLGQAALRSLLYGLPAVCFPAAGGLVSGHSALTVLVVSVLASWSMGQGLGYLGYLRLGWAGPGGAHQLLRAGLLVGVAAMGLTMAVTALLVPAGRAPFVFGFGQGVYVLSASALLVLNRELVVLAALAPGVLLSAAFLVLGHPASLRYPVWAVLAATPLLTLGLAIAYPTRAAKGRSGQLVAASDLRGAAPRLVFGLLTPGLVVLPILTGFRGHPGTSAALTLVAIPQSLSMGFAEWCMSRYRSSALRLLRTTELVGGFGLRSRVAVWHSLLTYLGTAAVLTGAAFVISTEFWSISVDRSTALALLAFLALGGAIYLSLLLHAFDYCWVSVLACGVALVGEVALQGWGVLVQVAPYFGLLAFLATYATVLLGRVSVHAR